MYSRRVVVAVVILGIGLQLLLLPDYQKLLGASPAVVDIIKTFWKGLSISLLIASLTFALTNELLVHAVPYLAGIHDVYDGDRDGRLFRRIRKLIEHGKKIDILAFHGIYYIEQLCDTLLTKSAESDAAIRIAIAEPNSRFVAVLRNSDQPPGADTAWCRAKKLALRLKTQSNDRIGVRLYTMWNTCSILRIDDRLFVTQYLAHKRSRGLYWYEIKAGALFRQYAEHFETIFVEDHATDR